MREVFKTAAGNVLPWGAWVDVGAGLSVRPRKRTFQLRNDATGEIATAPGKYGPGNDALRMALYSGKPPLGYAQYCFGARFKGGTDA